MFSLAAQIRGDTFLHQEEVQALVDVYRSEESVLCPPCHGSETLLQLVAASAPDLGTWAALHLAAGCTGNSSGEQIL